MSNNSVSNPDSEAKVDAVTAFWTQWLEQSSRGTQELLEVMQTAGDPQQVQRRWLDAMSQSLDSFMRSPSFLEMMKQQLKAITDLKGVQDQVVQGATRQLGLPLTSDISGLYERLHSTEQSILHRLQAIEERLKGIESKH